MKKNVMIESINNRTNTFANNRMPSTYCEQPSQRVKIELPWWSCAARLGTECWCWRRNRSSGHVCRRPSARWCSDGIWTGPRRLLFAGRVPVAEQDSSI